MNDGLIFDRMGVMVDCSRNAVINKSSFKKLVDVLSAMGYNTLKLYTEDTYEVDGEPYFGYYRGRFSVEELKEFDAYAKEKGIELVPCIQTLAHLNAIFRYFPYQQINDANDILLIGDKRTYDLIRRMFSTLSKAFSSRRVNIGMDEAMMVGRGKFMNKHGKRHVSQIMRNHLKRILAIAKEYGFECEMWADMFMRSSYGDFYGFNYDKSEKVKKNVPKDVTLVYWDYYHTDVATYEALIDRHYKLSDKVVFAGGAWNWLGFCPNNSYSIAANKAAITACENKGIKDYTVTVWGDNGGECSYFGILPTLAAVATYARGDFSDDSVKETFRKAVGMEFDDFMLLEKPDKIYSGRKPDWNDPSKVLLYSDAFCGLFDYMVKEGRAENYYGKLAKKLKKLSENPEWGYIFAYEAALCEVLKYKFELGVKTRRLYLSGDKTALKEYADDTYPKVVAAIENFYKVYEVFWFRERKPYGFDVQIQRMGGLVLRIKHCKERIDAFISGEVDSIPELEEPVLKPLGYKKLKGICYNDHKTTYTFSVT